MSTIPQPGVNGPEVRAAARRPANPQFIPLSELASGGFSMGALIKLVPAATISLIFNSGIVLVLLFLSNAEGTADSKAQTIDQKEIATLEPDKDNPQDAIDLTAGSIDTSTSAATDEIPGLNTPVELPKIDTPESKALAGTGGGTEGGFEGLGGEGAVSIPGVTTSGTAGFLEGKAGTLLEGEGALLGSGMAGSGRGMHQGGGYGLRVAANRSQMAIKEGASKDSEDAVARGLRWLARHQGRDGRWSLKDYHVHGGNCNCRDSKVEKDVENNDTAGTAFGLLPFLGAGETHVKKDGMYARTVYGGLSFLCDKQDKSVDPTKGGNLGGGMYAHALGAIALSEAYALSSDPKLRGPAQRAIDYLVYAQNQTNGGWRYGPRSETSDTSVVGWVVMALRSGQMAGLNVPAGTLEGAKKWLDSCAKGEKNYERSKYGYTEASGPTPAMTAAGLLSRQYLGWGPRNPDLQVGAKYLMTVLPPAPGKSPDKKKEPLRSIYYQYYATQVMHHMGGQEWTQWNELMREFLVRNQEREGHKDGSWDPEGADFGGRGGRIYTTSLGLLTLEVYYRHLPLYRRITADDAPAPKKEPEKK